MKNCEILLLIDETSVADSEGVTFGLNQAVKHSENPVMLPGEPHQWDSLQISWPATVLYSADEKKFRCWYSGFDILQTSDRFWRPGYAESDDGIHWVKPNLGQVEFLGADTNRIACDGNNLLSFVFENPIQGVAEDQRFVSLWSEIGEGMSYLRKRLAYSADGKAWVHKDPVYEGIPFNRASFQDISQVIYDPEESDPEYRFKGYTQLSATRDWDGREMVRHIGLVHGSSYDKLVDAPNRTALAPEKGIDEELHFAAVKKIGGSYLMLFESDNFSRNPIHGDLKLAISADGRSFKRVHPTTPLVATGPKGMWDENLLVTTSASMQEVGDEVYVFYIGCPNIYNSWPPPYMVSPERRGSMFAPAYLGLATLPRDRYAYAEGPGTLTTHPTVISNGLWLNVEGDVSRITMSARVGEHTYKGHLTDECSQGVYRRVEWDGAVPVGECCVRIQLGMQCRLYSIKSGG